MDKHEENESVLDPRRLRLRGSFANQIKVIFKTMRMTPSEVTNLERVYRDLRDTLNELWEGCEVKAFGSVVTGLALKNSDVDCFIDIHCDEDPVQCVERAFHFLSNTPTPFQVVFTKTRGVIPIMCIFHHEMQKYCDITFNGPIAIKTSELFSYLLDIDKTRSLAVLIKYWSKVHKIAGTALLPNIAMTILLIVFLQKEGILPSIVKLQENVTPIMINGWNTAFECINYEPNTSKSLYQLLGEFFEFYSNFQFADFVISPYLGDFVDRKCFSNINKVPLEFKLYKVRNATCDGGTIGIEKCMLVQCPFDHSRNNAIAVKPPLANRIIQCFRAAAESYRNYAKRDFLKFILNVSEPNTRQFTAMSGERARRGRGRELRVQRFRKLCRGGYFMPY